MSDLARLAAGVMMTGFDGVALTPELRSLFARVPLAGFILFARNVDDIAQVRALTDELASVAERPILAIDAEGGRVARFERGVEVLPPAMTIGAAQSPALARAAGEALGFDLSRAGLTLDFAPVLDLAVDPMNTAIGTRSFGADPLRVSELASAFASGLRAHGITPVFKHFPGHGATSVDSHVALPYLDADAATLRARDLVPFARLAPEAEAMMTAHVVARAIDPDRPATLSPLLLTDVLRDACGFRGVCFTDCLQMDAIAASIGTVAGVVASIAAGADCALVSHDPYLAAEAVDELVRAVERGELPRERLEVAHARTSRLRRARDPIALDARPPHPGIGRRIASRGLTLLAGAAHAQPTASIVVSFEQPTEEGVAGRHDVHATLRSQAPALQAITAPLEPSNADVERVLREVHASHRRAIVLVRRAHIYPSQARAITSILREAPDALVISLREPFDLPLLRDARHLCAAYGDDAASIGGIADVIFGDGDAPGVLPVALER
jgi:beta-N-acetylhexosaminidase